MERKTGRMKELVSSLREAAKAYYQEDREIMSNLTYDELYDELVKLEQETGVVMTDSPTVSVGYEALEELPKERHEKPMLSLNKTKSVEELAEFAGSELSLLSWKMDGLTIVLTYQDGILQKAVTRGNGEVGEVITNNARVFKNIPMSIPYKDLLILRGEAIIKYSDFKKINDEIEDVDAKYKNPRNLCSGTVRQLNNAVTARRNVYFYAFSLVQAEGVDFQNSREQQFLWLESMGFDVVEYQRVTDQTMQESVQWFAKKIVTFDLPSDGLVLLYDNIAYGQSLGTTAKFPRDSIAFKWADEQAKTTLREVEWSASRTGLINPVAVFEPVELEGTTVSRASVHNVSIVKELELGIGDEIMVYKANMIIPQIAENLTKSGKLSIPSICPVCAGTTEVRDNNGVQYLMCTNPDCQAKKIKTFALMVSRDALNIDGLSEATLEKFIQQKLIREAADLYHLAEHKEELIALDGFGQKSFEHLMESIEKSRKTTLAKYIYSLGIANIGLSNAKMLTRHFENDWDRLRQASLEELSEIDGVGVVIADSFRKFFDQDTTSHWAASLLAELIIEEENISENMVLQNMNFVVTGSVELFKNRSEVKTYIEQRGGKVVTAVSKTTSYLINNDVTSNSSKNKKAKELQIQILSEQNFLDMVKQLEQQ